MDARRFFLGESEFKSPEEIEAMIRQSKNFDPQKENPSDTSTMLIFQTSKQQTWLVASRIRLYCILDDINKSFTRIQWSTRKDRLVSNDQVTVRIAAHNRTESTGTVDVGEHVGWLYSKKLFPNQDIEARIRQLIARQMTP